MIVVVTLPIISFVGLIFNTLSIIVFTEQKGTASKYLAALSCSDVGEYHARSSTKRNLFELTTLCKNGQYAELPLGMDIKN